VGGSGNASSTTGTAGGSGSVGSGNGNSGSGSADDGGADDGTIYTSPPGCLLEPAGLGNAGCTACASCEQTYCCAQTNDCLNDTTCSGFAACQANCYNVQAPDGGLIDVDASVEDPGPEGGIINVGDLCAQDCLPTNPGALWNTFQDCISPRCDNPCLCP
jgi:hypothetical protein